MKLAFLLAVLAAALAPLPLHGQRELKAIPDPDPELERRSFLVAEGFEVNLFAADPLLAKPIQMSFDALGRLWVACSEVYPQIRPGQKADDKIIILEDRDGDGRADRTTVFAGGLLIPTGVEPGDGGAYVADSTDLVHLVDADGDGKADRRRVVLSGFGTEDTHHILHTLRWGPDGMLYMNQSIYIHSHIETPHGVRRLGGGGIWQFRPETERLEVFVRGFINPWGTHFDRWGQAFATDGAGGEGINYLLPGGWYATAVGAVRILMGLNPGSPKFCGLEFLSGLHLPPAWHGNLLTNDFRGHRVCRFVLAEDGAGFVAREQAELIKTNHAAFRPVDIKMGPDGAIYIADWYNPIIQHGEVDFRDPRRDQTRGRIWRVTAKGRPLVPRPRLVGAPIEDLLEALKAPEDWTRHFARRTLKERSTVVLPALGAWVGRLDPGSPEYEPNLLEALWTYQSLDVVEPNVLARSLEARDHRVRAAATRVLQHWHDRLPNAQALLAVRVADDHPRVRLEAVRVLGQLKSARAAELALQALDRPVDKYVDYALWLTARELEPYWLPAVQQGRFDFGGNVRHLLFALEAAGSPQVVHTLVDLVRAGKVPAEREEGVLTVLAALGGPSEMGMIFDRVLTASGPSRQVQLLTSLTQATRQRQVRPVGDLGRLAQLLAADNEALRSAAARAAGLWKVETLRPRLLEYARAPETSAALRQAALDGLVQLGGPDSRAALEDLASASRPPAWRRLAVSALAFLDRDAAAPRAVEVLAATEAGADPTDVFAAFLQHKDGAASLVKALEGKQLPTDVAKVGVRIVRTSGRDAPALVEALTRAGGLGAGPRAVTAAELQQLAADVQKYGNPARGEMVFRRTDQVCFKCHALGGAGGQVGPDLTSIGASAPADYLIDSILLPNKAIKENYHSVVVTTKDGRLFTGIPVRQTDRELILRNADDRETAIPLNALDEKANGGSLMPEGLADSLTRAELLDLVRFLSELGKIGPYALSKARLVRRWQVLASTPEARQHLQRTSFAAAAGGEPSLTWLPAYSTVAGDLPLADLPRLEIRKPLGKDTHAMGFVRCQLEATTAGRALLRLNGATGLSVWVDGVPVEAKAEMMLDLTAGLHTVTMAVDHGQRREPLRSELDDLPGSPARVRVVGGK